MAACRAALEAHAEERLRAAAGAEGEGKAVAEGQDAEWLQGRAAAPAGEEVAGGAEAEAEAEGGDDIRAEAARILSVVPELP